MLRQAILICAGLVTAAAGASPSADATPMKSDPARCAQYAKLVTDRQAFKDGKSSVDREYSPSKVYDLLKSCPSQTKLTKALYIPLEFMDYQGQEEEAGKVWADSDTQADIDKAMAEDRAFVQKIIDGYKQKVKSGAIDEASLKASMRYLIWNRYPDVPYSGITLELFARMYPDEFASVKELARSAGGYDDAWESVAQEWLPTKPPTRH